MSLASRGLKFDFQARIKGFEDGFGDLTLVTLELFWQFYLPIIVDDLWNYYFENYSN